jgi:hypothetical protein
MNSGPITITGSCHCGGISYRLLWPADANTVPARACSCSYCTRYAARWTSHPEAVLKVTLKTQETANRYRFGTATADFIFCKDCGVLCLGISRIEGRDYAVVNINTLTNPQEIVFDHSQSDFSAEDTGERLDRRAKRWIGTVDCQMTG